jgi:hypothetical protein
MALLMTDGFDIYTNVQTDMLRRGWSNMTSASTPVPGRSGGRALGCGNSNLSGSRISKSWGTQVNAATFGVAVYLQNLANICTFGFQDSVGAGQVNLVINTAGSVQVARNFNTTIASGTPGTVTGGAWNYFEFKTVVGSFGSLEVRMNGSVLYSASSLSTQTTSFGLGGFFVVGNGIGSGVNGHWFDDLYVVDSSGTFNNTFLGDCRIETLVPTADATVSGWTPNVGSLSYATLDETTMTNVNSSDYITAASSGAFARFDMSNLSTSPNSVFGTSLFAFINKSDTGQAAARLNLKSSTSVNTGTLAYPAVNFGTFGTTITELTNSDPATGAAWAGAGINAVQVEVERGG